MITGLRSRSAQKISPTAPIDTEVAPRKQARTRSLRSTSNRLRATVRLPWTRRPTPDGSVCAPGARRVTSGWSRIGSRVTASPASARVTCARHPAARSRVSPVMGPHRNTVRAGVSTRRV
jgi:hypothetical protein